MHFVILQNVSNKFNSIFDAIAYLTGIGLRYLLLDENNKLSLGLMSSTFATLKATAKLEIFQSFYRD